MSTQTVAVALPNTLVALPSKLSALLRLAVEDVMVVEQDPRYVLDMDWYHQPSWDFSGQGRVTCRVCLAGAVMVRDLNADISQELIPLKFGVNASKLRAIDAMRAAQFATAYEHLHGPLSPRWPRDPACAAAVYLPVLEEAKVRVEAGWDFEDRRADWSSYLAAADILEQAGL